jgi:flagellar biosynthesis/type III secretory pathway M-ring protein FliF/YscJ
MDTSPAASRPSRITPAQLIALGLIAASIGWAAWALRDRPASEEVELLPGTVLPSSELAIVEAAFDRAQLTGHRTEDGRVWVPRPRQSAYMRALVDAEALPREFGSSLRRALESNSPWQSRAAQEELLRVAVQEELAHVICSMPGIERAAVLYDVDDRAAFDGALGGGPTRTASVNVRTQPDVELEPARVQAIRVLVAASIAGLDPERVAVTDLRSGRVHAGPLAPVEAQDPVPVADPALARQVAHERHLAAKVRQGLAFVKGAVIDATVTFADPATAAATPEPNLPPRQQRVADANAPAEVSAGDVAVPAPSPEPAGDGQI